MKTSNIHTLPIQRDETYQLIETYRDLDRQIKALTAEKEIIAKELKEGYFSMHESYTFDGRLLATYRSNEVTRFNQSLFKEERPEIYEAYLESKTERKFLLK